VICLLGHGQTEFNTERGIQGRCERAASALPMMILTWYKLRS
jgi:hypothetical protein